MIIYLAGLRDGYERGARGAAAAGHLFGHQTGRRVRQVYPQDR